MKAVLFDLDGTLLPMDQDEFTTGYFKFLAKKVAPYGYEAKPLVDAIWAGTAEMAKNDGSKSNYERFWDKFAEIFGENSRKDIPVFDEFYRVEFQQAQQICGFNPKAAQTVSRVKELGLRTALATNPIFPGHATASRIRWAGLEPEDFEFYTAYEDSFHCKPNPKYFLDVAEKIGLAPEDCLMVGNDATEDLAAKKAGMQVFILTDCLINKENVDLSDIPHGDFEELMKFIESNVK